MELVIITAVSQFKKDIKLLLKKSRVNSFSYLDVNGYTDSSEQPMESNWFASEIGEQRSVLFYAFVQEELTEEVFRMIEELNSQQPTASKIHAAVLDIKKRINE